MATNPRSEQDSLNLLRRIIMHYAQHTGRFNCELVVGDLVEMIGEILAGAEYQGEELETIADDLRDRIVSAAEETTEEMDEVLQALVPLGEKH